MYVVRFVSICRQSLHKSAFNIFAILPILLHFQLLISQQQLLSPDMRNDLAGLFSPLPNSSAGAGNSSKKRARLTGKADDNRCV